MSETEEHKKEKRKTYAKAYAAKNREKLNEASRRFREKNPDYWKKYNESNKKCFKKYYEKNKEEIKKRARKRYKQMDPVKKKERAAKIYKTHLKKVSKEIDTLTESLAYNIKEYRKIFKKALKVNKRADINYLNRLEYQVTGLIENLRSSRI